MTKKTDQDTFNEEMFADIKAAKERAEIFPDTQVVNLKPLWNEEVTEESFKRHMDFANHNMMVLGAVVAEVAAEKYPDIHALSWTGSSDLGAAELHVKHYLRETYQQDDNNSDETESDYGITDMSFTYKLSPEHAAFYDHFATIDHERCQALFEDDSSEPSSES